MQPFVKSTQTIETLSIFVKNTCTSYYEILCFFVSGWIWSRSFQQEMLVQ